ncbi:YqgQ family protein [Oceanobacillus luteolus]|uniref:YqgQ family protein n=1 Tax=Oceanobacillus luteolus TaxID=1274358 RepID=A0ABW4HYV6_9BACI|nr:YqgQ family protein [Oceanobacillus luteolus]MCM3738733.1 YqgQ family protein [Oceanobacillus luteolus]
MKTVYDVRMLLKKFGTFIYSRNRIGDLVLMESELEELAKMNFISKEEYINGKLILQKEKNEEMARERD